MGKQGLGLVVLLFGGLILLAVLPYLFVFGVIVYVGIKLFARYQEGKGLEWFEGAWTPTEDVEKILLERTREALKKEKRIKSLLSKGYSAVCKDCEYAYHRKSSVSIKCPHCGSGNVENA